MRKTLDLFVTCRAHGELTYFFHKVRLLNIINVMDMEHPITKEFVCRAVKVEAVSWFVPTLYRIMQFFTNEDGHRRLQEMIRIGEIGYRDKETLT